MYQSKINLNKFMNFFFFFSRELYSIIERYFKAKDAFDSDIALWDIIYMAIETIVFFILIFVIEKLKTMPKFLKSISK